MLHSEYTTGSFIAKSGRMIQLSEFKYKTDISLFCSEQ